MATPARGREEGSVVELATTVAWGKSPAQRPSWAVSQCVSCMSTGVPDCRLLLMIARLALLAT
eukprot:8296730-Prorocentrum_lima.AAC.1